MRCAVILAFIALILPSTALAQRVELPVHRTTLSDGMPRYTVPIQLGGVSLNAMVDTGSVGLRVLARAMPVGVFQATPRQIHYSYGSGVDYVGVIAAAPLAVGALTPAAARFELIQSVGCVADHPQCPASRISAADYGIGGDGLPRQGFDAIIGLATARIEVANPFMQMGVQGWIIELPRSDAETGRLILNPTADDLAGFIRFDLDPIFADAASSYHDSLPGCLAEADGSRRVCGPVLLDSGAPGINISPGAGVRPELIPHTAMVLAFAPPRGAPLGMSFTAGSGPQTRLYFNPSQGQPRTRISAGSAPFEAYSVLYDPTDRVIGLKPR